MRTTSVNTGAAGTFLSAWDISSDNVPLKFIDSGNVNTVRMNGLGNLLRL
jgi:hypothetical protein